MTRLHTGPLRFVRGRHLYQITPSHTGAGYVGICDGRVVARALAAEQVARALIQPTPTHREPR
jgi:hypothetical protein